MQNNVNKYVRASEISSFYMCSRLVYFQRRYAHDITSAAVRAGFFKMLSHALCSVVQSQQPEHALGEAISHACADSLLVYGPIYEHAIIDAAAEARCMIKKIVAGLTLEKERSGTEGLMNVLSPSSISVMAYSDKLHISGTIDKVVMYKCAPVPAIISVSEPPETGIYASDRVRLAAYAMLISEKYDVPCFRGAVEYVPGWSLRWAEIRYEDKRKALYARNRVMEMDRGRMPDASRGKWCSGCGHSDACNVKPSLLSSLFK